MVANVCDACNWCMCVRDILPSLCCRWPCELLSWAGDGKEGQQVEWLENGVERPGVEGWLVWALVSADFVKLFT